MEGQRGSLFLISTRLSCNSEKVNSPIKNSISCVYKVYWGRKGQLKHLQKSLEALKLYELIYSDLLDRYTREWHRNKRTKKLSARTKQAVMAARSDENYTGEVETQSEQPTYYCQLKALITVFQISLPQLSELLPSNLLRHSSGESHIWGITNTVVTTSNRWG